MYNLQGLFCKFTGFNYSNSDTFIDGYFIVLFIVLYKNKPKYIKSFLRRDLNGYEFVTTSIGLFSVYY